MTPGTLPDFLAIKRDALLDRRLAGGSLGTVLKVSVVAGVLAGAITAGIDALLLNR